MSAAVAKPESSAADAAAPVSVAVVEKPVAAKGVMRLLRPIAEPSEIVAAQNEMRAMVHQALKDGRDYGKIPGTDKPTLLKPGAERVALGFGCYYGEPIIVEKEIDHDRKVEWTKRKKMWRNQFHGDRHFDWQEEAGASFGLYRYVVRVQVINRETSQVCGEGVGACSTMESKYIDRPRDSENTILKMAHKRAIVAACLVTFGLSDEFTQDVEDLGTVSGAAQEAPPITCDSQISWGKPQDQGGNRGKAIKDLEDDYLQWATQPGRKFGAETEKWQIAMRAEVELRKQNRKVKESKSEGSPANGTSPSDDFTEYPSALEDEDDDLPF